MIAVHAISLYLLSTLNVQGFLSVVIVERHINNLQSRTVQQTHMLQLQHDLVSVCPLALQLSIQAILSVF